MLRTMHVLTIALVFAAVPALAAAQVDLTPPASSTLTVTGTTTSTATIQWTAPGDDGSTGTATLYDLRYATSAITNDAQYASATAVSGEPVPAVAGTIQSFTVTGLLTGVTYYFALKTSDEVPNTSALSNSPSATIPAYTAYSTDFATAAGWTLSAPVNGVGWAADATPAALSPTNSLNYNDGTDYDNLLTNTGSATSPQVDISAMSAPVLVFRCNYQTATTGTATDRRYVRISNNDFAGVLLDQQLAGTAAAPYQCAAMGTWHQHSIPLTAAWGTIRVRFVFDTVDSASNAFAGWFVDDLAFDPAAPAAVTLAVTTITGTSVTLEWTATGDDGSTGTAVAYDLRYSTSPITTNAQFNAATQVAGEPAPAAPGTLQSMTVTGLSQSTTYYFAMKVADEVPTWSLLSNSPSATTLDLTAPAAVTLSVTTVTGTSITVQWTSPGDDGSSGTAAVYDLRYANAAISSDALFSTATQAVGEPAPAVAGTIQSFTVTGLLPNTTYFFALKTSDEVPNTSGLSNSPSATTLDIVAPAAITNLAQTAATGTSVTLQWTAPGDDASTGTAAAYDLRRSPTPITDEAAFTAAIPIVGEPTPAPAGTVQWMTISGLSPSTTYYFAMKTRDEVMNWSALSNALTAPTADTIAPGTITTLAVTATGATSITLQWTSSGDDGSTGTAASYDLRWSLNPIDDTSFASATPVTGEPAPAVSGTVQSMTVTALEGGAVYYFAMVALDEAANTSTLSNTVSANTTPLGSLSWSEGAGWALSSPMNGVGWAVDGTPATVIGGAFHSAATSLNYNNGTNYNSGNTNLGTATSPMVVISGNTALEFWCNYKTETTGTQFDQRRVQVSNDGFASLLLNQQLAGNLAAPYQCAGMGTWHKHVIPLSPSWGTIQVRFHFTTVDQFNNAHAGWFVDDITIDLLPPPAIGDLAVVATTPTSVTLQWTGPGDDSQTYDLRSSPTPITDLTTFLAATPLAGMPAPLATVQQATVGQLFASTTYYFAIRTADEWGNWSAISNVPTGTTLASGDASPPGTSTLTVIGATDTTVRLQWIASGDDGIVGIATAFDVRYSTSPIADITTATPAVGEPAPLIAGTVQSMTVTGLTPGTTYYFAMRTADEAANWGGTSNVPNVATTAALSATCSGDSVSPGGLITGTVSGSVTPTTGMYYTLEAPTTGTYSFTASASFAHWLCLFDSTGALITEGTSISTSLSPGLFYIAIAGTGSASGTFTLNVAIPPDTTPPGGITLAVVEVSANAATLQWTAPAGAAYYDVRRATFPIDNDLWPYATAVSGEPVPLAPGTTQRMVVTGLGTTTNYWFAIRAVDAAGNVGPLSNDPSGTTWTSGDVTPPAAIADLAVVGTTTNGVMLQWSSTGDNGAAGTAASFDLRYSTSPIVDFFTATPVTGEPVPHAAAISQQMVVTGLTPGTLYYFAIQAVDDNNNVSAMSNVVSASTAPMSSDTVPPSAIHTLAGTTSTDVTVTLMWTAVGDDNMLGTATSYDLRYSTSPITSGSEFNAATPVSGEPVPAPSGTVQTMTVSGLTPSTTYYFAIKAVDESLNAGVLGNSAAFITAVLDTTPPSDVDNLSFTFPGDNYVHIQWTSVGDDGWSGAATTYDLRYSTSPIVTEADWNAATQVPNEPTPAAVANTAESVQVLGLTPGTTYYFRLKVADEKPNWSGMSNEASGSTTGTAPDTTPPAAAAVSVTGVTATSVTLSWTAPGDDGSTGTASIYDIRYSIGPIDFDTATQAAGEPAPSVAGTAESFTVTGLTPGTSYQFALKTGDEVINWSVMTSVGGTTASSADSTPPAAAAISVSGTTGTSVTLSWTAPGDDGSTGTAATYDVRYSTSPITTESEFNAATPATGEPAPSAAGTAESFTVTGLSPSTLYYFALKTADEVPNWSSLTSTSGPTIDTVAPAAATLAVVSVTTTTITVSWTAPGDDGASGTAASYDLRYMTGTFDYDTATQASGEPVPSVAGTSESFTITGLTPGTSYSIALKSADEVPNVSGLSNVLTAATAGSGDPSAPSIGPSATEGQFRLDASAIGIGAATPETSVVIAGTITDPDSDPVQIEVELKPVGVPFDGTGTVTGAAVASGSVASATVPLPTDGGYHWRARSVDSGANTSSWVSYVAGLHLQRDTVVPVSAVTTSGALNASTYPGVIQGTASDATSGVSGVAVTIQRGDGLYFDGAAWSASPAWLVATGTTNWTRAFTPADGESYVVESRASDNAGLVQAVFGSSTFSFDVTEPDSAVATSGAQSSATYGGAIQGTAADAGSGVASVSIRIQRLSDSLYWTGSAWGAATWLAATGTASWSCSFAAQNLESYSVESRATDAAGNVETVLGTSTFSYNLSGPDSAVATSGTMSSWPGSITGSAATSGGATVTQVDVRVQRVADGLYWDGAAWGAGAVWLAATGTTSWSLAFSPAPEIGYDVASRATDSFGNVESTYGTATFLVDTVAPGVVITTSGEYTLATWSGSLQGTASDAGSGVALVEATIQRTSDGQYWDGAAWVAAPVWLTAAGLANWAVPLTVAEGESYSVGVRGTDGAGNVSSVVAGAFSIVAPPAAGGGGGGGKGCGAGGMTGTPLHALGAILLLLARRMRSRR